LTHAHFISREFPTNSLFGRYSPGFSTGYQPIIGDGIVKGHFNFWDIAVKDCWPTFPVLCGQTQDWTRASDIGSRLLRCYNLFIGDEKMAMRD
jgi:hypothetical protein